MTQLLAQFFQVGPKIGQGIQGVCVLKLFLLGNFDVCPHKFVCIYVLSVAVKERANFLIFLCLFFRQLLELFFIFLLSVCSLKKHIVVSVFYIVCAHSCNHRATCIAIVQAQDLCRLHE